MNSSSYYYLAIIITYVKCKTNIYITEHLKKSYQ